ncbi:MAG TPA: hypothetical protein VK771_02525 [Acidimicrobiia bacterium]|jgi:predicted lipoprotein with Yx(FWY)xxD motif|nr:hypothetical protein [Acidimicrobiia bacterium]
MKAAHLISTALLAAVMVLAGCSSSSKSPAAATTPNGATTTPSTVPGAATTIAAPTNPTLRAVTNVTLSKEVIVNSAGRTVYMFLPDGTSKTSRVPGSLKALWPAVVAPGAAIVGTGLSASKLAVDLQADGSHQVAYNGHLLYTFAQDTAPGDAKGQGLGHIWFALSPLGAKIS